MVTHTVGPADEGYTPRRVRAVLRPHQMKVILIFGLSAFYVK